MVKKHVRVFSLLLLFSLIQQISIAQTTSWLAIPVNNQWNNASNWSNGVPTLATAVVTIPTSSTNPLINIAGPITISDITIQNGGVLDLGICATFNVTNNIAVNAGGTLRFGSTNINTVSLTATTATLNPDSALENIC